MRSLPLALSVLTVAVLAALAGPAEAETRGARDARHDVVRYDADDLEDDGTTVPGKPGTDIVRHRFTYREKRIVAAIRFRDLRRPARFTWIGVPLQWTMDEGERGYGEMSLVFRRNGPAKGRGSFESGDASCNFHHDLDYRTDRVHMVIPANCLGSPAAIRAYAATYTATEDSVFFDTSPDNPTGRGGVRVPKG